MTIDKDSKKEDKPKISVVDRRHWAHEDEDSNGDSTSSDTSEERLPSYVEQLKKDAEDKDKRLQEYIAAYKDKNS